MSNWFTEHKTALSGAATIAVGILANPQALAAINPVAGAWATSAMGTVTAGIGLWNTWRQYKAAQNVIASPAPPQAR